MRQAIRRRREPVRGHLGHPAACARPSPTQFTRRYGMAVDAGRAGHRLLRRHRDDDGDACSATIDPGDEVIVFEPFYENYGPDAILSGATPRFVPLREPDWRFDPDELAAAFSNRTRAIIINTPNNPDRQGLFARGAGASSRGSASSGTCSPITDEIYEHIVYDGHQHVPLATLDGMAERTVTINGLSKTFSVTGWRIGWAIAPPALSGAHPQDARFPHRGRAGAAAGGRGAPRWRWTTATTATWPAHYARRRDRLLGILDAARLRDVSPGRRVLHHDGHRALRLPRRRRVRAASRRRHRRRGGAGQQLLSRPASGCTKVRFCFAKRDETMAEADRRLARLAVAG